MLYLNRLRFETLSNEDKISIIASTSSRPLLLHKSLPVSFHHRIISPKLWFSSSKNKKSAEWGFNCSCRHIKRQPCSPAVPKTKHRQHHPGMEHHRRCVLDDRLCDCRIPQNRNEYPYGILGKSVTVDIHADQRTM